MKSTAKIIKIIFVTIFILQMAGLVVLLFAPRTGLAADDIEFKPQITIPNSDFIAGVTSTVSETSIGKYIQAIYKYGIGIVGILATVVMMFGGFLYLTAAGDNSKISEAKEWIKASLTGLVIAMSSYMILATVNPALITLAPIKISKIGEVGCCSYTASGQTITAETTEADCPTETNYKFTSGTCSSAATGACITFVDQKEWSTCGDGHTSDTCKNQEDKFCGANTSCANAKKEISALTNNQLYSCDNASTVAIGACITYDSDANDYITCGDGYTSNTCKDATDEFCGPNTLCVNAKKAIVGSNQLYSCD